MQSGDTSRPHDNFSLQKHSCGYGIYTCCTTIVCGLPYPFKCLLCKPHTHETVAQVCVIVAYVLSYISYPILREKSVNYEVIFKSSWSTKISSYDVFTKNKIIISIWSIFLNSDKRFRQWNFNKYFSFIKWLKYKR